MIAKNSILFLFFACSAHGMHTSAFATALCLAHVQQNPIFTQAEQHEEDFIKNLAECSQHNNCNIDKNYQKARYNVLCSIHQLMAHHENLRQNTSVTCHADEKTEAKNMRKRLTKLLLENQ